MAAAALVLAASPLRAGGNDAAELDKLLAGRVAGEPVDCVQTDNHGAGNLTIIDGVGLVYRRGDTIYLNRTANPETLDWNDLLVTEPFSGSRLCRHDRVYTHDRTSYGRTGVVFLDRFVPYRKAS